MNNTNNSRSGGEILIDALRLNSVERIFCIPGESYLAALDALYDRSEISLVICRNEGGASYMAEAEAKLSGKPGLCFVTRGPGATNASGGLHVAMQDSTPMILLIGQVARKDLDREAFQEIDYRRMFSGMTKWVAQIDDADRIPEYINRAFAVATAGRPGPVVLVLPEDMLAEQSNAADAKAWQAVRTAPATADVERCAKLLGAARRPLILIGGSGWSDATRLQLQAFSEQSGLGVANSFRCQDYFDHEHPHYVGDVGIGINPALKQQINDADLLLVIGARLGEMTSSGFSLFDIPCPRQTLIHVHAGAEELGHIYQPTLAINASSASFVEALSALSVESGYTEDWLKQLRQARQAYLDWNQPVSVAGDLQLADIVQQMRRINEDDAILCNGAGNFSGWLHRFYRYRSYRSQLAPTSGTMGYGLPAAVAAKLRYPERQVVAFCGDGDFMMNGQELATAMQYQANIIVILVNNGIYATIRMHQERDYPGRVIGTEMINPDFVALAEAYGAHAERVVETAQFAPAYERALKAGRPALIELIQDAEILSATSTISGLRKS